MLERFWIDTYDRGSLLCQEKQVDSFSILNILNNELGILMTAYSMPADEQVVGMYSDSRKFDVIIVFLSYKEIALQNYFIWVSEHNEKIY